MSSAQSRVATRRTRCILLFAVGLITFFATRAVLQRSHSPGAGPQASLGAADSGVLETTLPKLNTGQDSQQVSGATGSGGGVGNDASNNGSGEAKQAAAVKSNEQQGGISSGFPFKEGPLLPAFNLPKCMEELPVEPAREFMTSEMYLAGYPTRLILDTAFLSDRRPAADDITIVVTYDVSRLYMLDGLCLAWGGAISAAVYHPVDDSVFEGEGGPDRKHEPLRDARYRVTDLHARVAKQKTCALDILLFTEAVSASDPLMDKLFPVNALRNRAMLMVHTELVLVLDGDLLVSQGARYRHAPGTPRGAALRAGAAAREYHVLPAFDSQDTDLAYSISAGNKGGVVAAFNKGTVKRFGAKNSRFPQGCTDYERWKTATEQYPVTYCNRYEPWGIVGRQHSPWFDSRFRGYGRNKIMYAAALNASRFEFVIDPDTFVMHRPHPRSTAQRVFDDLQDRRIHEHIMGLWQAQADSGTLEPEVDATTLRCKGQLPWWDGVAMHVGRVKPQAPKPLPQGAAAQAAAAGAKAAGTSNEAAVVNGIETVGAGNQAAGVTAAAAAAMPKQAEAFQVAKEGETAAGLRNQTNAAMSEFNLGQVEAEDPKAAGVVSKFAQAKQALDKQMTVSSDGWAAAASTNAVRAEQADTGVLTGPKGQAAGARGGSKQITEDDEEEAGGGELEAVVPLTGKQVVSPMKGEQAARSSAAAAAAAAAKVATMQQEEDEDPDHYAEE